MSTEEYAAIKITSPAFKEGEEMPAKYSCEGDGVNPPIDIDGTPLMTQSLALIAEDPDTSKGTFDHWVEWNIDPTSSIEEKSNPGISGLNGAGKTGYHPACPPTGSHRYIFTVYALDVYLDLEPGAGKKELLQAMEGHIIGKGMIMGRYEKKNK